METITVKLNDEQMAKIIYKVTEKMMLDANRIEVVRCKDCKYSKHLKQYPKVNTWKCILTDVVYRADDFCSYGERREE